MQNLRPLETITEMWVQYASYFSYDPIFLHRTNLVSPYRLSGFCEMCTYQHVEIACPV